MNYEQALKASKYNPAGVNKVLEGLEWECPKCKGNGYIVTGPAIMDQYNNCSACIEGKAKWKWVPKVGEHCLSSTKGTYNQLQIVVPYWSKDLEKTLGLQIIRVPNGECSEILDTSIIPILEWEVIEGILEKAGYELFIKGMYSRIKCEIFEAKKSLTAPLVIIEQENITRQEAVMKAVIELGKENKK